MNTFPCAFLCENTGPNFDWGASFRPAADPGLLAVWEGGFVQQLYWLPARVGGPGVLRLENGKWRASTACLFFWLAVCEHTRGAVCVLQCWAFVCVSLTSVWSAVTTPLQLYVSMCLKHQIKLQFLFGNRVVWNPPPAPGCRQTSWGFSFCLLLCFVDLSGREHFTTVLCKMNQAEQFLTCKYAWLIVQEQS